MLITIGFALPACAPPGPPPKEGSPVLFPSVPPPESGTEPVSQAPPGMPAWLVGKLDPNRIAWADNTSREGLGLPQLPHVAITPEQVLVDGVVVALTRDRATKSRKEFYSPMFNALKDKRESWKKAHPCQPFHAQVAFWIDDRLGAGLVRDTLLAATYPGFPYIHLVVRDRSGAGFGSLYIDHRPVLMRDAPVELIQQNEVFSRHEGEFQKCLGHVTGDANKPRGWMTALFTISADGRVNDISFECDTGGAGPGVRECIASELSKLRFPAPQNGPRRTSRIFEFEPKQTAAPQ